MISDFLIYHAFSAIKLLVLYKCTIFITPFSNIDNDLPISAFHLPLKKKKITVRNQTFLSISLSLALFMLKCIFNACLKPYDKQ